jgi:hypothetical protein
MIGAQNARMLVKNQCRVKTTWNVFFVSVHVWRKKAMVAAFARDCHAVYSEKVSRRLWRGGVQVNVWSAVSRLKNESARHGQRSQAQNTD